VSGTWEEAVSGPEPEPEHALSAPRSSLSIQYKSISQLIVYPVSSMEHQCTPHVHTARAS